MERLMAWLPTAVPADDGRVSVIHGDFSFHNLLIDPVPARSRRDRLGALDARAPDG